MKIRTKDIKKQKGIAMHNPSLEIKDLRAGITLIALVITIIVLLILAGVSIALLTGENGILTKATTASEQTKQQGALEKVKLAVAESIDNKGKLNWELIKTNVGKVEGCTGVEDKDSYIIATVDEIKIKVDNKGKASIEGKDSNDNTQNGEWTGVVNSPKLADGMEAVYWDESGNEVVGDASANWYNYAEKKWANAKTSDGSYWVWIPRYEYQITSGEGTSTAGTIEVKFISKQTTTASADYKIHPAFQDGRNNKYANGEWDEELSGIWVMKYEASSSNPLATDGGGNVTNLSMLSVPGVPSWRSIQIGTSYTNAMNYDRSKESHMMKNSEWGACAYLSKSVYGKNETEVKINDNSSYYTGGGEGDAFKTNVAQSTTGNITGIYDMSGGNWERVAAYITNGNANLANRGGSFATATESTKYATVYPYDSTNDAYAANYNEYKKLAETRYGDAILETSTAGESSTGWFGDYSCFPRTIEPFFARGGRAANGALAGVFAFGYNSGIVNVDSGFRACLAF